MSGWGDWGRGAVRRLLKSACLPLAVAAALLAPGASGLLAACGDGILEGGEACDLGASNGSFGSCCSSTCQYEAAGTGCRFAAGQCDVGESCTGSSEFCPMDSMAPAGQLCRGDSGPCDQSEFCDGFNVDCPADGVAPPGTLCRPAQDFCDLDELCDGMQVSCPIDQYAPPMTVCRPAFEECDLQETCTGMDPFCPMDEYLPDGQPCTDDGLFCSGTEVCQMGLCYGIPPNCSDGVTCTADYCDFELDQCVNVTIPDDEQARGADLACGTSDDNLSMYGPDESCGTGDDLVGDGFCLDNCPQAWNPDQKESDSDGLGDACDPTPCRVRSLYVLSPFDLWKVDPQTGIAQPVGGMYFSPKDVAIDPNESYAMVTDFDLNRIVRTTLATGAEQSISGFSGPWGIDLDPNGVTWIAERTAGNVSSFDPVEGLMYVFSGLSEPTGLDVNASGLKIFVTEFGSGELSLLDLGKGGLLSTIANGLNGPIAVELGPMETEAYVLEATSGRLVRVHLASGGITPVTGSAAFNNPHGLTLNAEKTHAFVTDQSGFFATFHLVDLATGFITPFPTSGFDFTSGIQLGPKTPVILRIPDDVGGTMGAGWAAPILADDLLGLNVFSADLVVRWNPTVLTATGVDPGGLPPGCTVGSNLTSPGEAIVSIFCTTAMQGAGPIAFINFQVIGAPGKGTPVQFVSALLNEGDPAVCTDDGSFFVPVEIFGDIVYYRDHVLASEPSSRPVDEVQVLVHILGGGGSVGSDTGCGGSFTQPGLQPVRDYQVQPRKFGDFAGAVDPFDASLNAQHVLGLISLTPWQRLAADVSGNGSLTSFDSSLIARFSVGLIGQFPVALFSGGFHGDWAFVPTPQAEPNQTVVPPVPSSAVPGTISFLPIVESAENQDFVAILYGDVSGNWQPVCPATGGLIGGTGTEALSSGTEPILSTESATAAGGRLVLPDVTAKPGQTIIVPVKAEGVASAVSFYLDVRFDSKVLSLVSAQNGAASSRFVMTPNTAEPGRGRMALYGVTPMEADGDVALLTFKVIGKPGSRTKLEMAGWTVNEGGIPVTVTQGSVRVEARRSPVPK